METNIIEVTIFGEKYKLMSDYRDPDRIKRVAAIVDEKMEELSEKYPTFSKTKIAILSALNLVDELVNLTDHYQQVDTKVMRVLSTIDKKLMKM